MIPLRTPLLQTLLIVCILLAAGCAGQAGIGTHQENATSTIVDPPGAIITPEKSSEEILLALKKYRENLTFPRNKIPESLLQITDPDYPRSGYLLTPEKARAQMITSRHLISADTAIKRFNRTNAPGQVKGDKVFLTLYVYPNTTTHILDPVVTNISNRKEGFHWVEAWVDVNSLETVAALDGVRGMELVEYAEHS
jgi:hypothetical protein